MGSIYHTSGPGWLPPRGLVVVFLVFLLLAMPVGVPATADTIVPQVTLGLGTAGTMFEGNDFELTARPEIMLEWPARGFTLGSTWDIPYYPDQGPGQLDLWQEIVVQLSPETLDLNLGNSDLWLIEDGDFEGGAYAQVLAYFKDTEFGLMLETQYVPEFGLSLMPSVLHEFEVPGGAIGIGVNQRFDYYGSVELGDTEFPITGEFEAGDGFGVTIELLPVFTGESEWIFTASLAFGWYVN